MVGGRLRDVVAHECSTVLSNSWRKKTKILFTGICAWMFIDHTLTPNLSDGCLTPASRRAS